MTDDSRKIEVSRVVDAVPAQVFAFLANPGNHAALDTSGMLRGSNHPLISGVGAVFVMNMNNDFKGDHQVENHVVVYEKDRAIGWAPAEPGQQPAGHTWVWRMTPRGESQSVVSQTYDWSAFSHLDALAYLPVINQDQMQVSLDRLADAVESAALRHVPPT